MEQNDDVIVGVPRLCLPIAENADLHSRHEGRPFTNYSHYWKNDWFSTRCFLVDKKKMEKYLPLVQGKLKLELLVRKYSNRAFPLDPEIVMFKSMAPRGARRLMLKSEDAWMTHPIDKSERFVDNLNRFLPLISRGYFPETQRGYEDMNIDSWLNYLEPPN